MTEPRKPARGPQPRDRYRQRLPSAKSEGDVGAQKRERSTLHSAELTIQPHMLFARQETRELVTEKLNGGVKPVDRKEPFEYEIVEGQLYVKLEHPIYRVEASEIIDPISAAIKSERHQKSLEPGVSKREAERHIPSELSIEGPAPAQLRAQRAAAITADKRPAILFAKFSLLTLTSKMGCYSFNLPAGPIAHGFHGTCPASGYGFPMLRDAERPKARSDWFDTKIDKSAWLCSGCYGLKGLYGSPLLYSMMECRKQFVESMLAMDRNGLVDILSKAIRMGQAQSMTERFFLEQMGPEMLRQAWKIPDPHYFRIHDVGDVWTEPYFSVWCDVARNLQETYAPKGLGFELPPVRFWMPTRMWMLPGPIEKRFICKAMKAGCVPENLTVRPSAPHFGQATPAIDVSGLAAGSGATAISNVLDAKDIQRAEKVVGTLSPKGKGWICPAFLPPELKGGGEWVVKGTKNTYLELVGGACARSWGPHGEPPAPQGHGCRVCWDQPDLAVVYGEH